MMTDPVADMLTRLRNAVQAEKPDVEMPASKLKHRIAEILKEEGFVGKVERFDIEKKGLLKVQLRYSPDKGGVIVGIRRVSRPGLRVYVKHKKIPRVLNGLGIAIISTSRGIFSDRECRKQKVGGEVLCYVW